MTLSCCYYQHKKIKSFCFSTHLFMFKHLNSTATLPTQNPLQIFPADTSEVYIKVMPDLTQQPEVMHSMFQY